MVTSLYKQQGGNLEYVIDWNCFRYKNCSIQIGCTELHVFSLQLRCVLFFIRQVKYHKSHINLLKRKGLYSFILITAYFYLFYKKQLVIK